MSSQNSHENSRGGARRLRLRFLPAWALVAVTAAMLGGCQLLPPAAADATRYYVLNASAGAEPAAAKPAARLQIGLRSVDLPAYLRTTKSMVVRNGSNEIRYQDYSRWAEPLDAGVNRILKERLLASSAVAGVSAHPIRGDVARDYDVSVRILSCEGTTGENAVARFAAAYEIQSTDGSGKIVAQRTFIAPELPWDGKDFSRLAELLSDGVVALGSQVEADLPK